jgi:hypothetical protein
MNSAQLSSQAIQSMHSAYTRTPFAQLVPVLATVFGNEFSTMIILFTPDPYWRRRGDLIAFGVKAASKRDQQIDLWLS